MDNAAELFRKTASALLKSKGISQSDLGRKMGVTPSMVNQYLAGRSTPGLEVLEKFAEALGVQPWQLIAPAEAARIPNSVEPESLPALLEIATLLPAMHEGQRDVLLKTARKFARGGDISVEIGDKAKKAR